MNVITLEPGSKGCDTIAPLLSVTAQNLFNAGMRFVVRYLVSLTAAELAGILQSGLALSVVSYANSFDPADELAALERLQLPKGIVVWLDVESVTMDPAVLRARVNTWAKAIKTAGYIPGMYVGAGCPLTSIELYALAVERYWHSCSRVIDSHGNAAEPACGWCMYQCTCEVDRAGVEVDIDFVYFDYRGRSVPMVGA